MVAWSDFSIETRHRILYYFCVDIIETYKPDSFEKDGPEWADSVDWTGSKDWPRSPQCLRDFTSALLTCRNFNEIITNKIKYRAKIKDRGKIKYRNKSPVDTLQSMQYEKLIVIVNGLSDENLERGDVEDMYGVVGCFWKNKEVLERVEFMGRILKETFNGGLKVLVPHLQAWVLEQAQRDPEPDIVNDSDDYVTLEFEYCKPGRSRWTERRMSFKRGSIKVGRAFWHGIHVCSIDAIITKKEIDRHIQDNKPPEPEHDDESDCSESDDDFSDETDEDDQDRMYPCDQSVPLVWEILSSDPSSWWVFIVPVFNEPAAWAFVNYTDRKMFLAPDPTTMYRWKNPWDVSSWKEISASGADSESQVDDEDDLVARLFGFGGELDGLHLA